MEKINSNYSWQWVAISQFPEKKASSLTVCEWRKIQFPFGCLHFCGFHYGIPSTEKRKTYQIQWKYSQYWFWIQSSVAIKAKWKHKVFQALDFWTKKSTHTHTHMNPNTPKGFVLKFPLYEKWMNVAHSVVAHVFTYGKDPCRHLNSKYHMSTYIFK